MVYITPITSKQKVESSAELAFHNQKEKNSGEAGQIYSPKKLTFQTSCLNYGYKHIQIINPNSVPYPHLSTSKGYGHSLSETIQNPNSSMYKNMSEYNSYCLFSIKNATS